MIAGALLFVAGFSWFGSVQKAIADWGKITLPDATRIAPGIWVAALLALVAAAYAIPRLRSQRRPY